MAIELQVSAETMPEGICGQITSEQDRLNVYAAHLVATFPGDITGISVGSEPPTDLDKAWLKLDNQSRPERIYYYVNGRWASLHPQVPGTIILWDSALPDFNSFDGGDANAVTDYSGPMWEEVTELRGRFPLGVGDTPDGTTIALGATGGTEENTLTEDNIPEHSFGLLNTVGDGYFNSDYATGAVINSRSIGSDSAGDREKVLTDAYGKNPPDPIPHVPPYYGLYFLRRTQRLYYCV